MGFAMPPLQLDRAAVLEGKMAIANCARRERWTSAGAERYISAGRQGRRTAKIVHGQSEGSEDENAIESAVGHHEAGRIGRSALKQRGPLLSGASLEVAERRVTVLFKREARWALLP